MCVGMRFSIWRAFETGAVRLIVAQWNALAGATSSCFSVTGCYKTSAETCCECLLTQSLRELMGINILNMLMSGSACLAK